MKYQSKIKQSVISHDILKTLLYFDIFHHPLNFEEISNYSLFYPEEIQKELKVLIDNRWIYKIHNFYSINYEIDFVTKRVVGNKLALKMLKKAKIIAYFISQFPFVRGVFISGSLSKGVFSKNDDIDFFILTKENRLWITRTMLIAFKKIFLLNSKKYFCLNYFKSMNALEIDEQNRFTATELATLIPFYCNGSFENLYDKNNWLINYFPNFSINRKLQKPLSDNLIKQFIEFILSGKLGNSLERFCMKLTINHQKRKFKKMSKNDFKIAFKSNKSTSKHHPENHQKKVIKLLNNKISAYNRKHYFKIAQES